MWTQWQRSKKNQGGDTRRSQKLDELKRECSTMSCAQGSELPGRHYEKGNPASQTNLPIRTSKAMADADAWGVPSEPSAERTPCSDKQPPQENPYRELSITSHSSVPWVTLSTGLLQSAIQRDVFWPRCPTLLLLHAIPWVGLTRGSCPGAETMCSYF